MQLRPLSASIAALFALQAPAALADVPSFAPLPVVQSAQKPVEALRYFCMYLKEDPTGPVASYATAQAKVVQNQLGNPVTIFKCRVAPNFRIGSSPQSLGNGRPHL